MKFNVSFGPNNIFSFDAKPVTNYAWFQKLMDMGKPVSDADRTAAFTNPQGTHAFGTLTHAREECGEGAYVTYAV